MPDGDANAERMQMALRRFELPLLQFATRITGDRERARDVVQETFVKFLGLPERGGLGGAEDKVSTALDFTG